MRNSGAGFSKIKIALPKLDKRSPIYPANILALQPVYVAAQLEQLKIFFVVDRLIELFQDGALPLGNGSAARSLDVYIRRSAGRMTASERLKLYARAFGFESGGTSSGTANREFHDLWARFVSSVSELVRQATLGEPSATLQVKAREAARDLAENLSLHGYGIGYFAASELQSQVNEIIAILSHPEIRSAYGAASLWQVIEQVATSDLGGAVNTARYRTTAVAGAIIIRWLAEHASSVTPTKKSPLLNLKQLRKCTRSSKPLSNPTDRDLADACEQWSAPDDKAACLSEPALRVAGDAARLD